MPEFQLYDVLAEAVGAEPERYYRACKVEFNGDFVSIYERPLVGVPATVEVEIAGIYSGHGWELNVEDRQGRRWTFYPVTVEEEAP